MNEMLLLLIALFSAGYVLVSWSLGKERLYSAIIVFLLLIATVGGMIITFFGYETNTGNIFYTSVFLATYFLIERYGKREGVRSILIGVVGVTFFILLVHLTLALTSASDTQTLSDALRTAFSPTIRIAFASLLAYSASQTLNVYLYTYLKKRWGGTWLWLRANIANTIAQTLDSVVFFVVAFGGVVAPANVGEIIAFGLFLKILYMMAVSPLLYLNTIEQEEGKEFAAIAVR